MATTSKKKAIVVLGSGRSGTALTVKMLSALGMSLSENLLDGGHQNPEGLYEDSDIVAVQERVRHEFGLEFANYSETAWVKNSIAIEARKNLQDLVREQVKRASSVWGFKDPRTSLLLPLWIRVFNVLRITPYFVLVVRNPAAVASSLRIQVDRDERETEFMWLHRNCCALYHTGGDCFVVHYEDWLEKAESVAQELASYAGLMGSTKDKRTIAKAISGIVKPSHNRAIHRHYEVKSPIVKALYQQLRACSGANFDRDALMQEVASCTDHLDSLKAWGKIAGRHQTGSATKQTNNRQRMLMAENAQLTKSVQDIQNSMKKEEKKVTALDTEHRETLSGLRTEMRMMQQSLDREVNRLSSEKLELQSGFNRETSALRDQFAKEIQQILAAFQEMKRGEETTIERLVEEKSQLSGQVAEQRILSEAYNKKIKSKFSTKKLRLTKQFEQEKEDLRSDFREEKQQLLTSSEARENSLLTEIASVKNELAAETHRFESEFSALRAEFETSNSKLSAAHEEESKQLFDDNRALALEVNQHLVEIKRLRSQLRSIRQTTRQQAQPGLEASPQRARDDHRKLAISNRKITLMERENLALRSSFSFRIGQVFVNAVAHPGMNTLMLPVKFVGIVLEYIFVTKEKSQE